jgi:3-hydroxybutyryl-CoA dehydrogenase
VYRALLVNANDRIAAVIGNGVIGHGIAEVMAKAGWTVHLIGRSEASLGVSQERIRASLAEFVDAGLLEAHGAAAAQARIVSTTDIAQAAAAELIFEAVPEDMALKRDIFAQLDKICAPTAILASSSGHPASELDTLVLNKERVVAAHFWYPPQLLPLVEVCGSPRTAPDVIERVCRDLRGAGKEPVVIDHELPGFIGNRIQFAALREAWSLWAAGYASAEAIDSIVRHSIGRRLAVTGPIESADLGGLDTMYHFARFLLPHLDVSTEPPSQIKKLIETGHRGVATGLGVRAWDHEAGNTLMSNRRRELLRWLKADASRSH